MKKKLLTYISSIVIIFLIGSSVLFNFNSKDNNKIVLA